MNIYFVRHGETDRNLKKMINPGDVDSLLNETGIKQAMDLGNNLKKDGINFDYIISSPLTRAKKSATIIAEKIGYLKNIEEIDGLQEKYAGVFKDYYKIKFQEEFGCRIVEEILQKYPERNFEGVESFADFQNRVEKAFDKIKNTEKYMNKNILIVAHGGVGEILTGIKLIGNCELVRIKQKK